ncbi:MAG: c-type cytochrome biogenesis protein CcsB [Bacillota bacterium]|uniref:c-type cytochrome biogenesis protein CcsB n=1 Tax=Thermanaerosceptrum fracticalcis TaxID=1712410 RepID=UPI000B1DF36E|nr:c-type cytochrome biogenesis protein CcsB [Thermanaerosceptrum fracticalcis]
METTLLYLLTTSGVFFLAAAIFYILNFFNHSEAKAQVASGASSIGFLGTTAALVVYTIGVGRVPLASMFEFGLFFLWSIVGIHLFIEYKYKLKQLGVIVLPMVFSMTLWLLMIEKGSRPLMPALRSNWLYFHVFTAIMAYGAFAVSFAVALLYLIKEGAGGNFARNLPQLEVLDNLTHKIIMVGMPFLTLCIVTGAVWAEYAWGSYWSWDPKETWSLITWFVYAVYLHARFVANWKGKKAIYLAIGGFLAVLFTFFGVNLLLPGLHSYK